MRALIIDFVLQSAYKFVITTFKQALQFVFINIQTKFQFNDCCRSSWIWICGFHI